MKKLIPIGISLLISVIVVSMIQTFSAGTYANLESVPLRESTLVEQEVLNVSPSYQTIRKLYHNDQLVGVLSYKANLDIFLDKVYRERYEQDFPHTKIGLSDEIYLIEEESLLNYANEDEKIFEYLYEQDLFSVEADRILFSNGAVIYVKDVALFETAKDIYLENFISRSAYDLIRSGKLPPELLSYGEREIGFNVVEKAQYQKGFASSSNILKTVNEIIYFLSYGYGTELEYYTVKEYDTVEGVAYKAGLSTQQVISINNDIIKSENQVLEVGAELNVTYFDSPINVIVTRERLAREIVYPESAEYIKDPNLQEGLSVVQTKEELGYKDVLYKETYLNGVLGENEILSSVVVKQPIREVIRIGTKVVSGIGSGTLRWPVGEDSRIICRWYCYANHQGLDITYNTNKNGPIYAADRGTISRVRYDWRNGYNVMIDHGNGMKTLYAHMSEMSPTVVGQKVEKGEFIGRMGNTGRSTGPHLHIGVYVNGVAKDPCSYLGC